MWGSQNVLVNVCGGNSVIVYLPSFLSTWAIETNLGSW